MCLNNLVNNMYYVDTFSLSLFFCIFLVKQLAIQMFIINLIQLLIMKLNKINNEIMMDPKSNSITTPQADGNSN